MLISDFSFHLPDDLIARYPANRRDQSRLMVLNRQLQNISESSFANFGDYLHPGDLLVLNDTKVIPARLFGHKESGGQVEILLVQPSGNSGLLWQCMLRSSKPCKTGQLIKLPDNMQAEVIERTDQQQWLICFKDCIDFTAWLQQVGKMPIPPYLGRDAEELDKERYQTVYAEKPGAIAAPTAGLHFTKEVLENLHIKGVKTATITLYVGAGTFQPVRVADIKQHKMHSERFEIPQQSKTLINSTRQNGGRVIAVGTTVARTLEHAADEIEASGNSSGETDIFIYPGYHFKLVDALLTNFHLPESTLLMLVASLAGHGFTMQAYQRAIELRYRFYSYGDAMLIT